MPDNSQARWFHLYFGFGRYRNSSGSPSLEIWRLCDRFVLLQGDPGGIVYPFPSEHVGEPRALSAAGEVGYSDLVARGRIDLGKMTWTFEWPADADLCRDLLRRMVNAQMLRYYASLRAWGPGGEDLGLLREHASAA